MYVVANHVVDESSVQTKKFEQLDLFTDYAAREKQEAEEKSALEKEKRIQKTLIDIKKKHGKNAILKGINLEDGATAKDRNKQIRGHKA